MAIELAVASLVLIFSVWFGIRKTSGTGKSGWVIGWMGLHRRKTGAEK